MDSCTKSENLKCDYNISVLKPNSYPLHDCCATRGKRTRCGGRIHMCHFQDYERSTEGNSYLRGSNVDHHMRKRHCYIISIKVTALSRHCLA